MTLVNIVGDFFSSVAPVFYEFRDRVTTHIIVSDNSKRDSKKAGEFRKGVRNFCIENGLNITQHFVTINEDSDSAIEKLIKFINENADSEVYINITDGLSSVHTMLVRKMKNVNFIAYDIFDNEYHIISKRGTVMKKEAECMSIKDHLLLKNIELLEYDTLEFANRYAKEIIMIFERYNGEFVEYKKHLSKHRKIPPVTKFKNIESIISKMDLPREYNKIYKLFTGTFFEYYVYLKMKEAGFYDVGVGIKIRQNELVNEFDVVVMQSNHLHIIECKYKEGKTLQLDTIIYRYSVLREMVDYDSKAAIVSLADYG